MLPSPTSALNSSRRAQLNTALCPPLLGQVSGSFTVGVALAIATTLGGIAPQTLADVCSGVVSPVTQITASTDSLWPVQTEAYQNLFGISMNKGSHFFLDAPVTGRGTYSGHNELSMPWTLLVSFTSEITSAGLGDVEAEQWASTGMTAYFVTGVMKTSATQLPFVGIEYSCRPTPGLPQKSEVIVLSGLASSSLCPLTRVVSGLGGGSADAPTCLELLQGCRDNYESNMDMANATFRVCAGTLGLACAASAILTGAFCLVNPVVCVGGGIITKWFCGAFLACIIAYTVAVVAAGEAYNDCVARAMANPACAGWVFP